MTEEEEDEYYDMKLIDDYFLLIGYAIECLAKGVLLREKPELLKDDKELKGNARTHRLVAICDEIKLSLNKVEKKYLNTLERIMTWGRYELPREAKNLPSPISITEQERMGIRFGNNPFKPEIKATLDDVFDRLYVRLRGD
jgi:hypothetical protein